MKFQAPVGAGTGTQKFSIKPGGGLQMESPPPSPAASVSDPVAPAPQTEPAISLPEPITPPTPFSRLYPGIDPRQEMVLDDKTRRIRFKPIETLPESPVEPEAPALPTLPAVQPTIESDSIAQLKAQLAEQNQIMTAMLQVHLTGRPLAEVLSGTPARPAELDYSNLDLYDDTQRAQFVKQLREDALATARAEVQAQMRGHLPSIQNAQKHGEYFAVQAEHGKDPDFEQKAKLANQLVGNNPNISFKATYDLISQIQSSLASAPAKTPASNGHSGQAILTPAQADAKREQAAKYPSTNGSRAVGQPEPPPEIAKNFKKLAHWVAQQQALGNLP